MSVVIGLVVVQCEDDFLVHLVGNVEYLGGSCHKAISRVSHGIFKHFLCLRIFAESKINLGKQCLCCNLGYPGSLG